MGNMYGKPFDLIDLIAIVFIIILVCLLFGSVSVQVEIRDNENEKLCINYNTDSKEYYIDDIEFTNFKLKNDRQVILYVDDVDFKFETELNKDSTELNLKKSILNSNEVSNDVKILLFGDTH